MSALYQIWDIGLLRVFGVTHEYYMGHTGSMKSFVISFHRRGTGECRYGRGR